MPPVNLALVALLTALQLLQFIVLPALLLPRSPGWGLLLVLLAPASLTLWALIHECIHGSLGASARTTERVGRGLSILFGAPWRVLRLGHLLHHRHNREPHEATEVYDDRQRPGARGWLRAAPGYYAQVLGGLYGAEVAASALAWLPAPLLRAWAQRTAGRAGGDARAAPLPRLLQSLSTPEARAELRLDGALIAALWAASALLYGRHAWMLAAALAARALLISLHDNVYHYGTPLAGGVGSGAGGRNLGLPRALSAMLLHFNLHDTHHRHPRLPWYRLRSTWAAEQGRLDAGWAAALLGQLRGPLPASRLAPPDGTNAG